MQVNTSHGVCDVDTCKFGHDLPKIRRAIIGEEKQRRAIKQALEEDYKDERKLKASSLWAQARDSRESKGLARNQPRLSRERRFGPS